MWTVSVELYTEDAYGRNAITHMFQYTDKKDHDAWAKFWSKRRPQSFTFKLWGNTNVH